jgi:hypothetical protein
MSEPLARYLFRQVGARRRRPGWGRPTLAMDHDAGLGLGSSSCGAGPGRTGRLGGRQARAASRRMLLGAGASGAC